MKVNFLGTGAGLPSKYRNTQSIVFNFMQELKECWMFDCGEATQHQIMSTTIRPSKINKIFISHFHGDHILGLIGFLSSRSFLLNKDEEPITIYGPVGIKEFVDFNIRATYSTLNYKINFVEFDSSNKILENEDVVVESVELDHTVKCYGFKISFKNKKGTLNVEKLQQLGIKPGPFYRTIKEQDVFEYNGVNYNSSDFLSKEKKGKVITIIPDTIFFDDIIKIIRNSDILITECTYLKEDELQLAKNHKHMNIVDIRKIQKSCDINKIFLTHISSRYDKNTIKEIQEQLEENLIVVKDLDEFNL